VIKMRGPKQGLAQNIHRRGGGGHHWKIRRGKEKKRRKGELGRGKLSNENMSRSEFRAKEGSIKKRLLKKESAIFIIKRFEKGE